MLSLSDAAVERLSSVMSNAVALLGDSVEVEEIFLSQSVDKNQQMDVRTLFIFTSE